MRILVTGATGLIGKNFIRAALQKECHIHALVRQPENFKMLPSNHVFKWNDEQPIPPAALNQIDAIINLSGENIADRRWSKTQKKRLVDSRIKGTKNLVSSLALLPPERRPQVFLSGSAIGYYGYEQEGIITESSPAGDDFLSELCKAWESEALSAEKLGIRVVLLRTGVVLSKEGGALTKMPPIQISNGNSWMSWIHIEDMVEVLFYSLKNKSLTGPLNCVSPESVQNKTFIKELARAKKVASFGFVPKIFIKLALGELSKAILSSLNVIPKILNSNSFQFKFSNLRAALSNIYNGTHPHDSFYTQDQFLPLKPEVLFSFFSQAENLEKLTPEWLNFKIISKSSDEVKMGTLIDYKLKIHGVPVYWKTLISDWKPSEYFIDDQIKGPYSKWHHVHSFIPVTGGCLLKDEVTYRLPGSLVGNALLKNWVTRDIQKIFKFRQHKIEEFYKLGDLG